MCTRDSEISLSPSPLTPRRSGLSPGDQTLVSWVGDWVSTMTLYGPSCLWNRGTFPVAARAFLRAASERLAQPLHQSGARLPREPASSKPGLAAPEGPPSPWGRLTVRSPSACSLET